MSGRIREPAVAGMFYPDNPGALSALVDQLLKQANARSTAVPKVLIVPHAGYVYSGAVAASGFVHLQPLKDTVRRVILLGPSHRFPLRGIAAPSASYFRTPLGDVPIDQEALQSVLDMPLVDTLDAAHDLEHSLEVQLPFLQSILTDFSLVPLVVGQTAPEDIAKVLEKLWGGEETLIVISSDLSHYHGYAEARQLDLETSSMITRMDYANIRGDDACGCNPLNGLLYLAKSKNMHIEQLDLRNSGDTAGSRDQVVGYGAFLLGEESRANA